MNNNLIGLNEKFKVINKMVWIKSVMNGTGGVGRIFERLLGKKVEKQIVVTFYCDC